MWQHVIVDTREQKPLWDEAKNGFIERKKLDEGDYTTPRLFNIAHAERKSGIDLYGSLIQGHVRFRNELLRANAKGLILHVFVECPEEDFYKKKFEGGWRLGVQPMTLRRVVSTMKKKYNIEFTFCFDRSHMKQKMLQWFNHMEEVQRGESTANNTE